MAMNHEAAVFSALDFLHGVKSSGQHNVFMIHYRQAIVGFLKIVLELFSYIRDDMLPSRSSHVFSEETTLA